MSRLIALFSAAILVSAITPSDASAGWPWQKQRYYYYCPPQVQYQTAPYAAPPAAPEGDTQQSQSVQPQQAPPAAPQAGTTYRYYSVEPTPAPAARSQSGGSQRLDPVERRLRPSNRFIR